MHACSSWKTCDQGSIYFIKRSESEVTVESIDDSKSDSFEPASSNWLKQASCQQNNSAQPSHEKCADCLKDYLHQRTFTRRKTCTPAKNNEPSNYEDVDDIFADSSDEQSSPGQPPDADNQDDTSCPPTSNTCDPAAGHVIARAAIRPRRQHCSVISVGGASASALAVAENRQHRTSPSSQLNSAPFPSKQSTFQHHTSTSSLRGMMTSQREANFSGMQTAYDPFKRTSNLDSQDKLVTPEAGFVAGVSVRRLRTNRKSPTSSSSQRRK